MIVLGVFAGLALLISSVGLYGVLAYVVNLRARELGIRMALGARRAELLKLVVGQGLRMALTGIALGIAGAFALTRLMANLLFRVRSSDPVTFVAVPSVLLLVSLLASYIPARRAAQVDPGQVLRGE